MKQINQYIQESILDDEDDIIMNDNEVIINDFALEPWLKKNFKIKGFYNIDIEPRTNRKIIQVKGSVFVINKKLTDFPSALVCFGEVTGDFYCNMCLLNDLQGCPTKVGGIFDCSRCPHLKNLEGAPQEVGGDFECINCNNLTSLYGAPKQIGGDFNCSSCVKLSDISDFPEVIKGSAHIHDNINLGSLNINKKPKVFGNMTCYKCKTKFEESEIKRKFQISGKIYNQL